jgi:glyoxylase-like metal-dependent hydrolase (beta-lactamase superfamily II)
MRIHFLCLPALALAACSLGAPLLLASGSGGGSEEPLFSPRNREGSETAKRQWSRESARLHSGFAFSPLSRFRGENTRLAQAGDDAPPRPPALGLTRLEVKPNLHLVVGSGTNTAFLVTEEGVVVVGAKESEQAGRELREVIAGVTRQPVRYLIHPNHQARYTHGSTAFPGAVEIIAHARARRHMLAGPAGDYWTGLAAASLPDLALTDRLSLYLGKTRVEVMHAGRGHTDGDLLVLFPDQGAVHTGDLFWNRRLPFIDRSHGGSANALLGGLQRLLGMSGIDTFIPGYGDVGTRADIQAQVALLRNVQTQVRQAIAKRRSRAQTIQSIPIPVHVRSDPVERFEALVGAMYDDLQPRKK